MPTITSKKPRKQLDPQFVIVSATEVQQNFSKYTKIAANGKDVVIQKNGKSIARIVAEKKGRPLLTDFVGILHGSPLKSTKDIHRERRHRYEATGRL